ncbi:LysE family translocator [Brumicola pallidula]|jgi:threonine/homoserine/homoserine lactone efflux protein|uniref:Lysine exporter protein LysE/YggA n=1 Tax=Brumicola pallidula DSM 14239 = ACAM 615 TaxID=1121922 RepID=K6Z953_9ALTE|nr:LysE family translocator [Glaciecola pallidula]GAC26887.1 lysine exporter protein LysE/YggA [Glaciecola pallidula DSM 14239 = ACAM 615]
MPDITLLAVFIPTWFFISITPGMCMTLAMTLGMSVGVTRTLWMMLGEVLGVATVAILAVIGVASLMLNYPLLFAWFKWIGGAYLVFLGVRMWLADADVSQYAITNSQLSSINLVSQGYITAVANPKGWAFMVSILPPFIAVEKPIALQFSVLLAIIMLSEFICMLIYANGGKGLKRLLSRGNNVVWLNRIAGSLLVAVGLWLALS